MSRLASLLRLRAADRGNAYRSSRLRHLHLSDRPLMLLAFNLTGTTARPLAFMTGTEPGRPQLLVAPPSATADPILTSLASRLEAYVDAHRRHSEQLPATTSRPARQRYTDAPQILVPNPQTAAYLKLLGRDLRLRPADTQASRSVRLLGQWLTHFADRAEIPGSSALIPLTSLLTRHWITGQSPLEDEDLATLLAWIDPPRDTASGRDAALRAEDPATHRPAGPATDAAFDTDHLAPLFSTGARSGVRDRTPPDLERLMADYMKPTWERMWQAYTLLYGLPEAETARRRWGTERSEFTDFCAYLTRDGRPQPARDDAVGAAIGLARGETAIGALDADRAAEDLFTQAELRTTGEAFTGTVTTVDPDRTVRGPTGRARWRPGVAMTTTDPVRLEAGQLLTCHTHRNVRYNVCAVVPGDDGTLIHLEITAGMGTTARPNHNILPDTGDELTLTNAPDRSRMPEFPPRDQTPWTHVGPSPGSPPHPAGATAPAMPQQDADQATRAVLEQLRLLDQRGVVVDSPPGAGKSTLVVKAAAALTQSGNPCVVIAQTNSQVDDLLRSLAAHHPHLPIARLTAHDHTVPADLHALPGIRISTRIQDLESAHVIVGTAMKWATVPGHRWPWAIIDEAYQMRSDTLLHIAARIFDKALFVGDPGQLDPFSVMRTSRWADLPHDPLNSAVAVLLEENRDLPVHTLPVSWRLPPSAVPLISEAFYPFTPFRAGSHSTPRALTFDAIGMRTLSDTVIERAAKTGWALLELPARFTHRIDAEALQAALDLAERLLIRRTIAICEKHPQGRYLEPGDIAIGTAHRDQAHRIRALLTHRHPRLHGTTVDTANRLQGREFSVTIVLHPLSGRSDASAFHLEAGRLCVLTSRHRHACIVVARSGIAELLDAHPTNDPVHPGTTSKTPDGWEANHTVLAHLTRHTIRA